MTKWIDRMLNWGHLVIPILTAIVVLLLGRIGCNEVSNQDEQIIEKHPPVSRSLETINAQILLRW